MEISKAIAIACATGLAVAPYVSATPDSSNTIISQVCGKGLTITLTIDRGDEDAPRHMPSACHAVCTESEDSDED